LARLPAGRPVGALGPLDDRVVQAAAGCELCEPLALIGLNFEHGLQRPVSGLDERYARELDGVLRFGGRGPGKTQPVSIRWCRSVDVQIVSDRRLQRPAASRPGRRDNPG
jgi:hypothetical protein